MKYQTPSWNGTMQALSAPGKLAEVKATYEATHQANMEAYDQAVANYKELLRLAVSIWGDGSKSVAHYLRMKDVPKPVDLRASYKKLEKKYQDWAAKVEAQRQAEIKRQQKAVQAAQRKAERAEKERIRREQRQREEAERLAMQRTKTAEYRERSQAMREILESLGYTYGIEFRDNAITFARKHIEEIRPGEWQRIIPEMEDLLPSGD